MKTALKKTGLALPLGIGLSWLTLDLLTKWLSLSNHLKPISIIEPWLSLVSPTQNAGIAFGLTVPKFILIPASLLLIIALIHLGKDELKKPSKHPFIKSGLLGIILGGAMGNLLERILSGSVTDFIHLGPIPTFNLADIGITMGLLLFVGLMINEDSSKKNK